MNLRWRKLKNRYRYYCLSPRRKRTKKIEHFNERLAALQDVLREHEKPAGLAGIMKCLSEGADWERRARTEECRRYIARNEMPDYMVGNALKNAADSVPQSFIDRVADICGSLDGFAAKDFTELADGMVVLSQTTVDSMYEAAKYVYSDERAALIPRVKALVAEIRALRAECVDVHRLIDSYTSDRPSTEPLELTLPLFFIRKIE